MMRRVVRRAAAVCAAAAVFSGAPLAAQTVYQPVAPWLAGAGPGVEQYNFWQHTMPMMFRTHQQMLEYRSTELKADVAVVSAALGDTLHATPDFTADDSVDIERALAAGLVKAGASGTPEKLTSYFRDRYTAYEKAAKRDGVPANSLTTACAYSVEAAYATRDAMKVTPAERRDLRGACVLLVARAQALGLMSTNKQRFGWAHAYADLGGMFLEQYAAASNEDGRKKVGLLAAQFLVSAFDDASDPQTVPIDRFPCILNGGIAAGDKCSDFLRPLRPKLGLLADKFA